MQGAVQGFELQVSDEDDIPSSSALIRQCARADWLASVVHWWCTRRGVIYTDDGHDLWLDFDMETNIEKSQLRPSSAAARQPPHPLRAAFRILSQKPFSTTSYLFRDHHFDTLKLVQRLKDEGFSEEQSKAMMLVLSDVIEESIQNLTRTMVLREDADRSTYTQKVDFTKLRSELLALDSSDTSVTLASHERLSNDIAKLNSRLRDEIGRAQASVRLDLNLEKGRIREEAKGQELKIKETETRIEQEVAGLRERVEGVKFSTLQWLVGVCTGAAALILGAWRLLM
ncbi:MAG: hypothetical protein Q9199_000518 [Rusavskia elegans]